jgi:hypothetical protein
MKHGGIHVQRSYEVYEFSVLAKDSIPDMNRTHKIPFDGRSSKEQLVGVN